MGLPSTVRCEEAAAQRPSKLSPNKTSCLSPPPLAPSATSALPPSSGSAAPTTNSSSGGCAVHPGSSSHSAGCIALTDSTMSPLAPPQRHSHHSGTFDSLRLADSPEASPEAAGTGHHEQISCLPMVTSDGPSDAQSLPRRTKSQQRGVSDAAPLSPSPLGPPSKLDSSSARRASISEETIPLRSQPSWRDTVNPDASSSSAQQGWGPVKGFEDRCIDLAKLFVGHRFAEGTYGKLYRGLYEGMDVAVKIIKLPDAIPGDTEREALRQLVAKQFRQETAMLSRLEHPNIINFIGACQKPPTFCVVSEYCPGGSVRSYLSKVSPLLLPLPAVLAMALDIARGMEYLHSQGVIHRDLKPDNLLLMADKTVKISDFGLARIEGKPGGMTNEMGTYRWMAPEIIEMKPYDRKADVFSFSIVLWQLLTSETPYAEMTSMQAAFAVCSKDLRPPVKASFPQGLSRLMQQGWQKDPSERPSFTQIVARLEAIQAELPPVPLDFPEPPKPNHVVVVDGREEEEASPSEAQEPRWVDSDAEVPWHKVTKKDEGSVKSSPFRRMLPKPSKALSMLLARKSQSAQCSPIASPAR